MQQPESARKPSRAVSMDDTGRIASNVRSARSVRTDQAAPRSTASRRRMEVHIPEEKLSPGSGRHMSRKEDDR